jgi:septal ring factor EnvC (AmiA/AmiB activator)
MSNLRDHWDEARKEHAESTRLYEQRLERLKHERDEALACFARSAREYAAERAAHEATKAERLKAEPAQPAGGQT